jgi:hypothetical protein
VKNAVRKKRHCNWKRIESSKINSVNKSEKRKEHEYFINNWHYSPGFMASGFHCFARPGLVDPRGTYYCNYTNHYLVIAEGI